MMQEEELVIKDELATMETGGRQVLPFYQEAPKKHKYIYSYYEIFAALVMTLSTISGGLLEGYASPAIPSMILCSDEQLENVSSHASQLNTVTQNAFESTTLFNLVSTSNSTPLSTFRNTSIPFNSTQSDVPFSNTYSSTLEVQITTESSILEKSTSSSLEYLTQTLNEKNVEILSNEAELTATPNETVHSGIFSCSNSSFHITEEAASWLGSVLLLGACIGAIASPWVIIFGRRHAVLVSALPRFIGWLMIAASSSVAVIDVGRFLTGISIGMVTSAAPIYISEISHASLRGSLSCLLQLGVSIGIFLASLFGTFLSWRELAVFGCISVLVYFVPTLFIPNSPSWLVWKGRENDARKVLAKLRVHSHHTEEELQQIINIVNAASQSKSVPWKDLFVERRCRFPLLLVILVSAINRFSGYNAIITYCATFLNQAVPSISQYWGAVGVSFIQILATAGAIPLVDRVGRRKLLLTSVLLMGSSLCLLAIFEKLVTSSDGFTWLVLASTMVYVSAYAIGIGPLTWVLLGEMFPLDARDRASAIVAFLNWFAAFLITKTYFSLETFAGVTGTCLLYSSVCFFGAICFYFLIPETRGRTLAEIEAHFSYQQHSWKPFSATLDQALSSILEQDVATIDSYNTFQ